jgi:hypothetical protein
VADSAVAATCTTAGKTAGSHCSVCKAVITAQKAVPAKGHTLVADPAVAATCTAAGKTAGSHCSVCKAVITAQKAVAATGHNWDDGKITKTTSTKYTVTYTCKTCKDTKKESKSKEKNPIAPKSKSKNYREKDFSKAKTVSAKDAFGVIKADGSGKITYKLVKKGTSSKPFKINSSGKVTIKAGTKAGTYKLQVKITAAGDKTHKKMSKTVIFTIRVKK